jgi:hypothetical protein
MRRRRPVPLLLLLLLITSTVVYAFLASFSAEREYTALVHELGSGEGARVLESTYSRGIFTSRAATAIESEGLAGVLFRKGVVAIGAVEVRPRVGIHMSHEIEHGVLPLLEWVWDGFEGSPVLARMKSKVELDQETQLALAEVFGKLPAIDAATVIRTSGRALTTFSMPADRLHARGEALKRGAKVIERDGRWEGVDGELDFSQGFRSVTGFVHSPGFESRGERRIFKVTDVTWAFQLPGGDLPIGRMNLSIGEVAFDYTIAGTVPVELHDLDVDGESKAAAGGFGASVKLSLRALRLGDDRWGPGSLEAVLANVDGPGFRQLRSAATHLSAERPESDPAKTAVLAAGVLDALPQLLARHPKLELARVQLKTPTGLATATGRFSLIEPPGGRAIEAGSFLDGQLRADLPASALEDIVDAYVRAGLAADGADASDEAAYEAMARERRAASLADLYRSGFTPQGDRAIFQLAWAGAGAAPAPAAPPAEKASARPGRRAKPQPAQAAVPAPAPAPAAAPVPAPAPAAPAPAPAPAAPAPAPAPAAPAPAPAPAAPAS